MLMRLRATSWNIIRQNQHLYDTAVRFGVVPMTLPLSLQAEKRLSFYMVFSTSENASLEVNDGSRKKQSGKFNWRHWRTVESIFYHHPNAAVNIFSNTLPDDLFNVLTEAGYSIKVQRYSLEDMLVGEGFIEKIEKARKSSDPFGTLMKLTYSVCFFCNMDTDIIVVRPLDSLERNTAGRTTDADPKISNAFPQVREGKPVSESMLEKLCGEVQQ